MKRNKKMRIDSVPSTAPIITTTKREPTWTRSQFAQIAGLSAETVRFYEKKGLLEKPSRSLAGYRLYQREHVMRLLFIRNARDCGFTLAETHCLLQYQMNTEGRSRPVKKMTESRLATLNQEIRDLNRKRKMLEKVNRACSGKSTIKNCPILKTLQSKESSVLVFA